MAERVAIQRAEPRTVDEARRAVAESRERMSDTLDAIEGRLVAKKQQLSDRMDVMRPVKQRVRARPWPAIAVAFGIGVLVWKLRHQRQHAEHERHEEDHESSFAKILRRVTDR
jgi:ElaB/YqjD/DUF883 family membrane-anchored ribosome-binding protein